MKYDKSFGKRERRISMQGEIAFAVARDEAKPFIVSTPPTARIEVLGTEFPSPPIVRRPALMSLQEGTVHAG